MFVVVQEIKLKKPNPPGHWKKYEVTSSTFSSPSGGAQTYYSYYPDYSAGQFERPHQEAYKISIHQSYREGGKVKKRQCAIGTIRYYDAVPSIGIGLYDCTDSGISRAVKAFGVDYDTLYKMVEDKMNPIMERICREYRKTEEYKARRAYEKLQKAYEKAKKSFAKRYSVSEREYDACFDIFGALRNGTYLAQIRREAEAQRSYSNSYSSNYSSSDYFDWNQLFGIPAASYSEEERKLLKKFFRALSMKYHPDLNPDTDTTKEMQLLNKLKEEWGV